MKIAYVTAGAGGMFCGSCMHDNTLVRALCQLGEDAVLIPTYTPIRTDEHNESIDQVFFGGINVYLQQQLGLFRWLPRWLDRVLDRPGLIRWAVGRGVQVDAKQLGALAVSMLRGMQGRQRKEVRRLATWLATDLRPDCLVMSNMLIAGCVPEIKRRLAIPVYVTLQGDDIFLGELVEPHRTQAIEQLRRLTPDIDGFLVNSRYYAEHMGRMLELPADRVHSIPLGLDTHDFEHWRPRTEDVPTIGYLARLAPEKGLHNLIDAYLLLRERSPERRVRLRVAGWLGPQHRAYAEQQFERVRAAGWGDDLEHVGEVDRAGKLRFLGEIDILSVPTTYQEPKGLFVLEALAAGVPVVQPEHGAFPELLGDLAGGLLVRPNDATHLAETLESLLGDAARRRSLGEQGRAAVLARHDSLAMARATLAVLRK